MTKKSFSDASELRKEHFSHRATAGPEAFATTRGTAMALKMTVGSVVMIQADKAEEFAVTATAMVVVMSLRTLTVSRTIEVLQGFAIVRVSAIVTEMYGTVSMQSKAWLMGAVTAAV